MKIVTILYWQLTICRRAFMDRTPVLIPIKTMKATLVVLLALFACSRAVALDTDADYVQQQKSYTDWVPCPPVATMSNVVWSEDFGFAITPGNYEVIVNHAYLDDNGSVGGISPTISTDCSWPHAPITPGNIVALTNIMISPDGHKLGVAIVAVDNPSCGSPFGYVDVNIVWEAKCSSCSSESCAAGNTSPSEHSLYVPMGLGKNAYQQNAGQLLIQAAYPSPALAQPAGIQAFLGTATEGINDINGILRQVCTSQLLADIIVSNDFCYSVNFYTLTNFSTTQSNGLYQPLGQPYTTITVQNPDASTNLYNRLWVTQTGSLGNHEYDYEWLPGPQQWVLTSGGGLRTETRTENWDASQTILTETNVILNANGTPVFKQVETYEIFPWGQTNLVQRVVDPDGANPQTNTWVYYDDLLIDGDNYGLLKQITQPSGYWERYEYDSETRLIKKVSQFGNAAIGALESQCRVTSYSYDIIGTFSQLTTTNLLLGREIGRSYGTDLPGVVTNIVCQTAGAAIDAPDNLITVTTTFTNGDYQGQTAMVQNPDGTVSVYQYSSNPTSKTTVVWSGAPDWTGTNVVDGTETVSVVDPGGNAISNATFDVASGLMLSSAVTLQTDMLGRPTVVQYNDGSTETTLYGCCGIDSQTDREGIATVNTYDELKRLRSVSRAGITTFYTYDAYGRTLTTTRQGTDNSQILQDTSVYDVAGNLIASTNALNYGTTYLQAFDTNGDTIKTTINPDNSTRIETYYQDGSLQSVTGTAVQGVRYEYGVDIPPQETAYRAYTREIKLNADGSDTQEWTKSYRDPAGRAYKTVYSGGDRPAFNQSFYNNLGQLCKQVDPDGVTTLYQYNARGQVAYTAVDMDGDGVIDFGGSDRISHTVNDVLVDNGVVVNRTRTYVWPTVGVDASNLVSAVETSVNGLQKWSVAYNHGIGLTNYTQTVYNPSSACTVITTVAPDGSFNVTTNLMGQPVSVTGMDANGVQLSQSIFGYDAQGRQNTATDARNGTATSFYDNADQLVATLSPSPDGIQGGQLTTNILDSMGRAIETILPDNTSVTNLYYTNGLLQQTYGSRTYPVAYTYDYAGRMRTMTTWTNFTSGSGAAITTWNYDSYRGWLSSKQYADGQGPAYYYTSAGRLLARRLARGLLTSYAYGAAGNLSTVHYSDYTPGLGYGFDRLGRQTTVTNGPTVTTWTYNDVNEPLAESYTGGPLDGMSVTNGYDNLLRRGSLSVLNSASGLLASTAYGYDAASRLLTVASGNNTATYFYLANSPLVGQIAFANSGTVTMATTKQYDYLNRLTGIQSGTGISPVSSFNYAYNSANQRTQVTNSDNSHWVYQYDNLGQVISGKKYWSDGTPVAGQQFAYNFDDIGNRQSTASGGDASGNNLRPANYTANNLNQYTSRDVPGYATVLGSANPTATVTVNLQRAVRQGSYFWDELPENNSVSSLYISLTNLAVLNNGTNADIVATNVGNVFLPRTPEAFGYDADGNTTNSGRWTITWDAENRALSFASLASAPLASQRKVDCTYDFQGRRIQKIVSTNSGSAWVAVYTNKFVYDGWNLVAILDSQSSIARSFTWGTDLSGSEQGAGGVGGLLTMSVYGEVNAGTFDYSYDGNGNVAELVNAASGTVAGQWEYGPFGEVIRVTGPTAKANAIRFSTKYQDDETEFSYYGYRYYNWSTGRWPSRDPMEELGGGNLFSIVRNDLQNSFDILGLYGPGGHFYTVYAVAIAKGYTPQQAYGLAYFAQLPDQVGEDSAWDGPGQWTSEMALENKWLRDIQEEIHSLHGGDAVARRNCLRSLVSDPTISLIDKGIIIHAFGDSYAHSFTDAKTGQSLAYSFPFGHGAQGHTPDLPALRPQLYANYVNDLYGSLPAGSGPQNVNLVNQIIQKNNDLGNALPNNLTRDDQELLGAATETDLINYLVNASSYNFNFRPELGGYSVNEPIPSEDLGTLSKERVQKIIDLIKTHCGCKH